MLSRRWGQKCVCVCVIGGVGATYSGPGQTPVRTPPFSARWAIVGPKLHSLNDFYRRLHIECNPNYIFFKFMVNPRTGLKSLKSLANERAASQSDPHPRHHIQYPITKDGYGDQNGWLNILIPFSTSGAWAWEFMVRGWLVGPLSALSLLLLGQSAKSQVLFSRI